MLINQLHRIGGQLLFLDALIMFSVVQFVQIALDFPAFLSCQLDCIGKNAVACLLHVETPCVVGRGVFEENVALPETVRPGRAAEPQKGLVLPVGACRRLCDNLFVNV